jgi:hypothetical protein
MLAHVHPEINTLSGLNLYQHDAPNRTFCEIFLGLALLPIRRNQNIKASSEIHLMVGAPFFVGAW